MKPEIVSGSGISWAICKSAPRSRQITTPAPQHPVFTGRMPPNQQRQSTEGTVCTKNVLKYFECLKDVVTSVPPGPLTSLSLGGGGYPPQQPQYSNGSYNGPAMMESPPRPGMNLRASADERLHQQTVSANQQYERVSRCCRSLLLCVSLNVNGKGNPYSIAECRVPSGADPGSCQSACG